MRYSSACFLSVVLFSCTVFAGGPLTDWPQFMGPARDGVYAGEDWANEWPKEGPKVLWERKVGAGWSGPVVAGGKVILFHRVGDRERVECVEAGSGKEIWSAEDGTAYRDDFGFDEGPRATPVISGDRVITFGADGLLTARAMETGKTIWQVDTQKAFRSDKGFFGRACSPLVEGEAVVLNLGGKTEDGRGAGVATFARDTGKVLWQATGHEAGYASPVAATIGGKRVIVDLTREGLVGLEPASGRVIFEHPFRASSRASVNAASPVVVGDHVFISASYGTGAALLKVEGEKVVEVWANDESLSAHYATPVFRDGFLYGFDGRQEQGCGFRCVEMKTGKVVWNENGFGAGTVIRAGGDLLVLHEGGELIRVGATPEKFEVRGRVKILGGEVRATAGLAGGLYFARDRSKVVCVDLRKG